MRVLLPLNNNQSEDQKQTELGNEPTTNSSSSKKSSNTTLEVEPLHVKQDNLLEESSSEKQPNLNPVLADPQQDLTPPEKEEEQQQTPQVTSSTQQLPQKEETLFPAELPLKTPVDYQLDGSTLVGKRLASPAYSSVASAVTSSASEGSWVVAKRPRTGEIPNCSHSSSHDSSDDSKPPAKPIMVAPKREPSPSMDGSAEERRCSSPSSLLWEENEPAPIGNQNYYRNRDNRHFVVQNNNNNNINNNSAATAARPQNHYNDLVMDCGEEEEDFAAALKSIGLNISAQAGDGNCLFRAVSLQVYGDSSMHAQVREQCLNFMAVNEEHFGQFLTDDESFESYIARKRQLGVHGNNPEIQAISELFNRPVQIYSPEMGIKPLNIFHKEYKTADAPIRLSYHDNNHYNAVVDPYEPTAGVGLGLPGLKPGLADKLQVAAATTESDLQNDLEQALSDSKKDQSKHQDDQFQRALKESSIFVDSSNQGKAIALSDVDATNFELEQTILETSLQAYREEEGRKKRAANTGRRRRPSPQTTLPQDDIADPIPGPQVAAAAAAASPSSPEPASAAAAAATVAVATSAALPSGSTAGPSSTSPYDYPSVVQELVMNGFELSKVARAYELVGDNFDDLLAFLMSSSTNA